MSARISTLFRWPRRGLRRPSASSKASPPPSPLLLPQLSLKKNAQENRAVLQASMFLAALSLSSSFSGARSSFYYSTLCESSSSDENSNTSNNPRKPPIFGMSIAHYSTKKNQNGNGNNNNNNGINNSNHHEDPPSSLTVPELKEAINLQTIETKKSNNGNKDIHNNCPICEKYSQGPCGKLFNTWLQCTDEHPGHDAETGQELHLIQCADRARHLAECLRQNESYYERPFDDDNDNNNNINNSNTENEDNLKQEWERLIREELKDVPRNRFPAFHTPQFELRPTDRVGVVSFDMSDIDDDDIIDDDHPKNTETSTSSTPPNGMALLMVFVLDATSGEVLAAAMPSELWQFSDASRRQLGVLQCHVPVNTSQLQACALYEDENDPAHQVVYTHTANVPMAGLP